MAEEQEEQAQAEEQAEQGDVVVVGDERRRRTRTRDEGRRRRRRRRGHGQGALQHAPPRLSRHTRGVAITNRIPASLDRSRAYCRAIGAPSRHTRWSPGASDSGNRRRRRQAISTVGTTKQRQSSDKAATKQRAPPPRLLRTHLQVPGPLLPVLRGDRRVLGTVQQRQLAAVHVEAAGAAPRSRRVKRRFTAYRPYVDPGRISTAIQRRFEEIRRDSQQRKGRLCARAAKQRQVLPVHRSTCLCVSLRATIWMFATTHSTQFSNRIGSDQSSREWNQVLGAPGRGRSVRAGTHRQSMSSSQLTSGSYLHRTTRDPL